MYTKIPTPDRSSLLVFNAIIANVEPLLVALKPSYPHIQTGDDLQALVVELFVDDSDFESYSEEVRMQAAFTLLNMFSCVIDDKEEFIDAINHDLIVYRAGFSVGFDKSYHPVEQGHFFTPIEFIRDAA
jgi:hypothetical protein